MVDQARLTTSSASRASWRADPSGGEYDAVRAHIVEAAASCIEQRGLPNLRINEVAEKAGCSRANFYRKRAKFALSRNSYFNYASLKDV